MSLVELKRLFKAVSRENPSEENLSAFRDYHDRKELIAFINDRIEYYIDSREIKKSYEWGMIHAVRLTGEIKAKKSVPYLVRLLEYILDDYMSYLFSAASQSLSQMGKAALEPVLKKHMLYRKNIEITSIWLNILVELGVNDERINNAVMAHYKYDPVEAIMFMGYYKDASFLPVVKRYVTEAANILNDKGINPFEPGKRFENPEVDAYINTRDVWVELETGLDLQSPEFDKEMEALDNKLLKFSSYTGMRIMDDIGETGSEFESFRRSVEESFEDLKIETTFGNTVAILLAAISYPDRLSMDIIFQKIYKGKDVVFDTMDQVNKLTQSVMGVWNKLISYDSPDKLKFLEFSGGLENYISERLEEISEYLAITLHETGSDIFKYNKDSQILLKNIENLYNELKKFYDNKELIAEIDPAEIQGKVLRSWNEMFLVKSLEAESRKNRIDEGGYNPNLITKKIGRNDPCPCGSGKKYKHCCMN